MISRRGRESEKKKKKKKSKTPLASIACKAVPTSTNTRFPVAIALKGKRVHGQKERRRETMFEHSAKSKWAVSLLIA